MGTVHYIAKTNDVWIKNLIEFKEGLKGYICGDFGSPVQYYYSDYKKRSKKARINFSASDFTQHVWKKDDANDTLDFYQYIQQHLVEGEICTIHLVTFEHAHDLMIEKIEITNDAVIETVILEDE